MKKYITNYVRYNLWANTRLVEVFKKQDDALISKHIESSFPSVRETMMHLWDVEVLWLARLQGQSPTVFPSKSFSGSNTELFENLLVASKKFVTFVEKQPAKYFITDEINYKTIKLDGAFVNKPYEMMWHCMNHQSFHRGQLVMFARQLGITTIPSTDFIIYLREQK
jgi:uncharacterized damage-inducible protein DinB